jgi:hypothetical protein
MVTVMIPWASRSRLSYSALGLLDDRKKTHVSGVEDGLLILSLRLVVEQSSIEGRVLPTTLAKQPPA